MARFFSELDPKVARMAEAAMLECTHDGLNVLVTCTYRSGTEQDALYAQGRSKPGPKVTNARAGQSFHQYRVAIDLYPLIASKPDFSGKAPEWHKIAKIFKSHGFEWAYEWKRFKEMPHFQYTGGHPLSYFQKGGKL